MKFYIKIPQGLKAHYNQELSKYQSSMALNDFAKAWKHLENAHVLGQAYPYEHSKVHWFMLLFGFKIKSLKEIIGQIPRLLFGGVKSFVGKIPVGNTGGANVSALRPMEIDPELKQILDTYKNSNT